MRKILVLLMLTPMVVASAAVMANAQDIKYGIGNWDPESGLGNHRAVVRVSSPLPAKRKRSRSRSAQF